MKKTLVAAPIAAGILGFAALAMPIAAQAATGPPDTSTTFTVNAGDLTISAPGTAALSTAGKLGVSSPAGQLGTVTVTDNRGDLEASWSASAVSTNFTTGTGTATAAETIPAGALHYSPGGSSNPVGDESDTFSAGAGGAMDPSTPVAAYSMTGTGANAVSWDPTIDVTLPTGLVHGDYTGMITHSVA